jgi:outer membrane protein assembly factor BamE (lipoprotein component of BamABCDE complex)
MAVAGVVCFCSAASAASTVSTISDQKLAKVMPGMSTKVQVQALLGTPWRIVQFNDCGHAMPGQADETWDYRGKDAKGTYRIHIEFDDNNVASLVAKIPDQVAGGKGTAAKIAPADSSRHMQMTAKSMAM